MIFLEEGVDVHVEVQRRMFGKIQEFMALVETQSKNKFKAFQLDNGGKFILEELKHF
jgi:hypothetical protein